MKENCSRRVSFKLWRNVVLGMVAVFDDVGWKQQFKMLIRNQRRDRRNGSLKSRSARGLGGTKSQSRMEGTAVYRHTSACFRRRRITTTIWTTAGPTHPTFRPSRISTTMQLVPLPPTTSLTSLMDMDSILGGPPIFWPPFGKLRHRVCQELLQRVSRSLFESTVNRPGRKWRDM